MTIDWNDFLHDYKLIDGNGQTLCELNLFEEEILNRESKFWLNGIYTKPKYYRKGYAQQLIERAIDDYGEIYISVASDYEHKQNGDTTARELTIVGAKLVNGLKQKGILKDSWFVNPFGRQF